MSGDSPDPLVAEMLEELRTATALCQELCTVALNKAVADHLPFGCRERVEEWLRRSRGHMVMAKAESAL